MNEAHRRKIAAHKREYERKKRAIQEAENRRIHPDYYCAYCGIELEEDMHWETGFCSVECEDRYGSCPKCGSPSRGNRQCLIC